MRTCTVLLSSLVALTFLDLATAAKPRWCSMEKDTGPCRAMHKKFFFNSALEECEEFVYGGCKGNENRFDTMDECTNAASDCDDSRANRRRNPDTDGCIYKKNKLDGWSECNEDGRTTRNMTLVSGNADCPATKEVSRPCADGARVNGRGNGKGKGRRNKKNKCVYDRKSGDWSECTEEADQVMTKEMTLKKGPEDCPATRTVTKPCAACTYDREVTGCVDNKRTISFTLSPPEQEDCPERQPKEKPCGKKRGKGARRGRGRNNGE